MEVVLKLMVAIEEVAVVVVLLWEKGLPRAGVFLDTIFLLPLPHFKLVLVSISSWLTDFFFFNFFVAVGDTGDADDAGVFKVAGVSISFGEVAVAFVGAFVGVDSSVTDDSVVVAAGDGALVCFRGGDEIGLFFPCLGDPLLFRVTSNQPS